jgi:hypothetical protein
MIERKSLALITALSALLGLAGCGPGDSHSPVATATSSPAPTPTPTPNAAAAACTASGGTVSSGLCCAGTSDFPSLCGLGACGCAPAASHQIQLCACGDGRCFDGSTCITR